MPINLERPGVGFTSAEREKQVRNIEKIEGALQEASSALPEALSAKVLAGEAKTQAAAADSKSENVQTQLNNLVLSGDSSPQATQASVGADGTEYGGNLKARLDAEHNKTVAQLADKAKHQKGSVNIEQYDHFVPNKSDARVLWDWTIAFQNAINDTNGTIKFGDNEYLIGDIEINKPIDLQGASKKNTLIRLKTTAINGLFYTGGPNSLNNIKISDLAITGGKGLKFYNIHRWVLDNVEIKDVAGVGFHADYSWVGTITSCYIHHNAGIGVHLVNDANAVAFVGCEIQGNSYGVYIADNVLGTSFNGSTIEGNRLCAIYAEFAKVLSIDKCYFEKNGFQPGENIPHPLAHIYIKGSADNKAYGVSIKGSIFNEIRTSADGTQDGYSIYLDSVIRPVMESNAYLYNGLGAIYCTPLTHGAMSINDFTNDEANFLKGTTSRLTRLTAGRILDELELSGNLRGRSGAGFFISSEAASGWAFVLQSKNAAGADTPRMIIPAGTDKIEIQTRDNDLNLGTGLLRIGQARVFSGSGSPEGVITANVGSLYLRNNGSAATTLYVKESLFGNTGWIAK